MKSLKLGLVLLSTLSLSAKAAVFETKIASLMEGETHEAYHRVFLTHKGEVVKFSQSDRALYDALLEASDRGLKVQVEIDEDHILKGVQLLDRSDARTHFEYAKARFAQEEYLATVVPTETEAQRLFDSMRDDARNRSQCFNRAHVWTYEMKNRFNTNSMKVFLFFTRRYIRNYNYKWWFHVSPYLMVNVKGKVTEKVIDNEFTRGPLDMKDWTDMFMKNKVNCPAVELYSQYDQHQQERDCYLMKTSMYYWEPTDLEKRETEGLVKTKWEKWEVDEAYRQGFRSWF